MTWSLQSSKRIPKFLFIAEAYWDLEWELQQQGFDFCYDKRLYDRLEHENAESVRLHLCADLAYQDKLAAFHREPRRAARGCDLLARKREGFSANDGHASRSKAVS